MDTVIIGAVCVVSLATGWAMGEQAASGGASGAAALHGQPPEPIAGRFVMTHWYQRGVEHGNPKYNSRFRVNDPEVVLHPAFGKRSETRENGLGLIELPQSLFNLKAAELYLEIWGGHPHTADKRVTINGRSTYRLPEVGAAAGHCTHLYPTIRLKITDLVHGHNALQFACDKGTSFWGHFIVDNMALRAILADDHPLLKEAGLIGFTPKLTVAPGEGETLTLRLEVPESSRRRIRRVDFIGRYEGYDENGNTLRHDWHGMTKHREPYAIIGSVEPGPPEPPEVSEESEGAGGAGGSRVSRVSGDSGIPGGRFELAWDVSMLPDQAAVDVRAVVHFAEPTGLSYETPMVAGIALPDRDGVAVKLIEAKKLPAPFWSRADQRKAATIELDIDPTKIERAELHVVAWDGGTEKITEPTTLNGHALKVVERGGHDVLYRIVPIEPGWLKRGDNEFAIHSDTHHHGIEILRPGPALIVRHRP